MRFTSKLVLFAVCLTAVLGAYRVVEKVRDRDEHHDVVVDVDIDARDVDQAPERLERPELPERPEVPERPEALSAPGDTRVIVRKVEALPGEAHVDPREVRIVTNNRAAFMALRDDHIVAGLTDSLRKHIEQEMNREVARERSGVGAKIAQSVVSGVNRLLEKELEIPVSDVRDIHYNGHRIVIQYRGRREKRVLNLENIKTDGDRTLLEQFSEADARRFVDAVKVRIR